MGFSASDATAAQLADLLRWYGEMGVDAVLDDRPHDRFAEAAPPRPAPPDPAAITRVAAPPPAVRAPAPAGGPPPRTGAVAAPPPRRSDPGLLVPDVAVAAAREAAGQAATLDELRTLLEGFDGCGLRKTASRLVFADGNPAASVMLVGEAPGAEEDRSGVPFVGRGGQLLDRMLAAAGLDRTHVYIANVVPWRPPGNREPTPQEVATCLPFVQRQIALCDPDILLLMGNAAFQALAPGRSGITKARGRWLPYETGIRTVQALPMLHPAYLLRQPGQKKLAWRDWRTLRRHLDGAPPV